MSLRLAEEVFFIGCAGFFFDLIVDGIVGGEIGLHDGFFGCTGLRYFRGGHWLHGGSSFPEVDAVDGLWHFDAFLIEGFFDEADGFAFGFREVVLALIDPCEDADHHRAVAEVFDDDFRGGFGEDGGVLFEVLSGDAFHFDEVELGGDTDDEIKAAEGVAGVIEEGGVHDHAVGDAQVIAIESDEDGIACGQEGDLARVAINLHGIADLEGIPCAE